MKRITCSILIVLAASALYINSTDGVQAEVGIPVSDRVQAEMGVSVSGVKHFDAQEALTRLNKGFLPLDGQGESSSTEAISRQDFVIFIVHTLNLNADSPPEVITFKDVPKDHFAFTAIEAAVQEGLVKGVGNGRFGLGLPLTRQDMAMLYQRALRGISDKIGSGAEPSQQNLQEGSSSNDAKEAMALALELGLFRESSIDGLDPKGIVTREEAVWATAKWLESVASIDLNADVGETETPPKSPLPVIHGVVATSSGSTSATPVHSGPTQAPTETGPSATVSEALPTTAPSAPNDLRFHHVKGQAQLTWTHQQGVTYNIYSSGQSGAGYALLAEGSNVDAGSYAISDVRFQEPSYYVIEAVNSFGKSGYSNEVSSRPNKVSGLQAILNEEDESIALTWSDAQEGVTYHVYYTGPDGAGARLNDEPLESPAYLIPNLHMLAGLPGRYTIHVVAVNEWHIRSEPSNEVALDVRKDPVDRITIMDPSVALPSEDLAEETVTEQESAPEEQKDQEDQEDQEEYEDPILDPTRVPLG